MCNSIYGPPVRSACVSIDLVHRFFVQVCTICLHNCLCDLCLLRHLGVHSYCVCVSEVDFSSTNQYPMIVVCVCMLMSACYAKMKLNVCVSKYD